MPTLELGVLDIPYEEVNPKKNAKETLKTTTGEVAEKLEREYQVMQVFFENYREEIGKIVLKRLSEELDNVELGKPTTFLKNAGAETPAITELFTQYLDRDEWQKITGRVIKAAQLGHSKRFKDRFNKKGLRGPRPAFIDTGTYQGSFRSRVS